jgi:hypothetical protein
MSAPCADWCRPGPPLGEWKARLLADPTQFMAAYLATAQKAA